MKLADGVRPKHRKAAERESLQLGSSGVTARGHLLSRERLDLLVAYVSAL